MAIIAIRIIIGLMIAWTVFIWGYATGRKEVADKLVPKLLEKQGIETQLKDWEAIYGKHHKD